MCSSNRSGIGLPSGEQLARDTVRLFLLIAKTPLPAGIDMYRLVTLPDCFIG